MPGIPELLVIFFIILLLFGAAKLPQLGKGLGESIKNFKLGLKSDESQDQTEKSKNLEQ